jgi:Fe-S-cluster-containing hydrogenase component 2
MMPNRRLEALAREGVRKARSLLHDDPSQVPEALSGAFGGGEMERTRATRPRRAPVEAATLVELDPAPRLEEPTGELQLDDLIIVSEDPKPVEPPARPKRKQPAPAEKSPDAGRAASRSARHEGSVLRRVFHSVVTVVPSALKTLVGIENDGPADKAPVSGEAWRELRTLPFFDGMPNGALESALAAGDLALVNAGRDDLIDVNGRSLLVKTGQVALARFDAAKLEAERNAQAARKPGNKKDEKREQKRRQEAGPLIAMAERNLAFFEEGDLVDLKIGDDLGSPPKDGVGRKVVSPYACYAVTGARVVSVARARLEAWKREFPFLGDRLRRASQAARQRIDAVVGAREEVADFFIRHGLSVAQTLRVRQIDKCVECGECEKACETRYGAQRLHLSGKVLGGLDFVDACHTCTDQRCIDPCAFDAIKYDAEKREVVIVEAACTGCTLCATACPYQAIEMHDLEAKPLLQIRLSKEGKLAFGEGTPRKAKLKRMASKCDHCIDYGDQACISACPTGALFEVAPGDVFHARPEALRDAARAGYDQSVVLDLQAMHDPAVFARGIDAKVDRARAIKPRIWTTWMWVVGLGAWLLTVGEIVLRKVSPALSIDYLYQTLVEGIDAEIALSRVDFRPGCELAVRLGYIGTVIMFSGMLYPARRRIPALRNLGSQRAWFEMHVLTGVIGPLFILLHTVVKLDNWVSMAFWSMVATVVSGLVGRYLSTQIPERASSAALDTLEVDRKLAALRARHATVRAADDWYHGYQRRVAEVGRRSIAYILGWLVADDVRRATRQRKLHAQLGGVPDPRARREAARYAARLALFERRRVLLPRLEPLFKRWKLVHVPAAIALTVIGGIHIAISLFRG